MGVADLPSVNNTTTAAAPLHLVLGLLSTSKSFIIPPSPTSHHSALTPACLSPLLPPSLTTSVWDADFTFFCIQDFFSHVHYLCTSVSASTQTLPQHCAINKCFISLLGVVSISAIIFTYCTLHFPFSLLLVSLFSPAAVYDINYLLMNYLLPIILYSELFLCLYFSSSIFNYTNNESLPFSPQYYHLSLSLPFVL